MWHGWRIGLAVLVVSVAGSAQSSTQQVVRSANAVALRRAIATREIPGAQRADYARLSAALLRLYADSAPGPLWFSGTRLTAQAQAVLGELRIAETRGLRASDHDVEYVARRVEPDSTVPIAPDSLLRLDAALSLSVMRFIDHVHRGRIDPRSLGFALDQEHSRHDLAALVASVSRSRNVHASIDSLEPPFARYRALENTLVLYRALAADSSLASLPPSRVSIRPGQAWAGVAALERLLVALNDLPAADARAARLPVDTFGGAMVDAVKRFQRRHGLQQDGVIGSSTLGALRTPLSRRVLQIELAMERWRWLPDTRAPRFVVVNIPAFRLLAFDREASGAIPKERLDVIVGAAYGRRHTPVFTNTMRYVVFHPFWDVPPSIARREEVPRIRRDPTYAYREELEIVRGGDVGATVFPMTNANLDRVAAGELRLRQRPGPANALGPVKFVFPNEYNVYLHGTPAQALFERARRDFSHGCIRVRTPERLARFVLAGQSGWNDARIADAMSDSAPQLRVTLERPIPVYILYVTAVTGDDGTTLFYPDLYGHDAALERALAREQSATGIASPSS